MRTEPSITHETPVAELVGHWLTHLRAEGRLEDTTINEYERVLRKLVVPELGDLPVRELTTSRIDEYLDGLAGLSVNRRRKAKVVTGAMLELAIGFGARDESRPRDRERGAAQDRPATAAHCRRDRDSPGRRSYLDDRGQTGPEGFHRYGRQHRSDAGHRRAHRRGPRNSVERYRPRNGATGAHPERNHQDRTRQGHLPQAAPRREDGFSAQVRSRGAPPATPRDTAQRRRRCLPDQERHLAAGQQGRTAVAADPAGHRTGVGHPTRVPHGRFGDIERG